MRSDFAFGRACCRFYTAGDKRMRMKTLFILLTILLLIVPAFAHEAFTLVSSERRTVTHEELAKLESSQTTGTKQTDTLSFKQKDIRLVVITGPEDDMLSYRIQGIRNPTLAVPGGVTIRLLFVNVDSDMRHDLRFGRVAGPFTANPDTKETVGSQKLPAMAEDHTMQAEELVLKANENGTYKYFCSVGSHAKNGMWGNIAVGVKPGALETPAKQKHVHTPDEDKMENMPGMKHGEKKPGGVSAMPSGHNHGEMDMQMSSVANLGDPMQRESSGTSWAPDSSPVYARMKMLDGGGMLMLMGTQFVRYTSVGSTRDTSVAGRGSRSRVDAPSMFMLMYSHPVGESSQIGFRAMASLDPVIERGYGYPLLYQSGEQYAGEPLHDRQHPHDLISELAVTWSHKFGDKRSLYLYAGYPGEPALGPPMYLHRISGMNNPDAPIGHHWQDSTHISFGVVTAGYSFGKAKIETSIFKGREPNANRWNFDRPKLDSYSGRFSFNPTSHWALQISHVYLKNPEESEPEVRILRRTTASALYNRNFGEGRNAAGSVVWGQNYANGQRTNAVLLEGNYDLNRNAFFGRIEGVQKSGHDLVLEHALENSLFWVGAASAGYLRDVVSGGGLDIGIGGMATFNINPSALTPYYGGTTHGGWQIFMRLRPSKLN